MNIVRKDIDPCRATLSVLVAKADYAENVDKKLHEYRKKANLPGFRSGMVPISLLRKMYGKSIIVEELNNLLGDELTKYVNDNRLETIGEPLPSEAEQPEIDFETQEDFEFVFDIAFAPAFEIELSPEDKVKYYDIEPSDEMIENLKNTYIERYGKHVQETNVEESDVVKGKLEELENGELKADGRKLSDAVLTPKFIEDDAQKALFTGAETGAEINFNPAKAFNGNEVEISSLFKVEKEDVKDLTADFRFTIEEITRYHKAELNQELFDKIFGENTVKSEEEFTAKIKEGLARSLKINSDRRFQIDARQYLLEKYTDIEYPLNFLKRWIKASNAKTSDEELETEFPKSLEALKWQVIINRLLTAHTVDITEKDLQNFAKKIVVAQFEQYGIYDMDKGYIEQQAKKMLEQKDAEKRFVEKVAEEKIVAIIKKSVTLDREAISIDDFNAMP
jgi:trigger factor